MALLSAILFISLLLVTFKANEAQNQIPIPLTCEANLTFFGHLSEISVAQQHSHRVRRIVNGSPANVGEFPFVAHIFVAPNIGTCGGALITTKHVLTAAHCFFKPNVLYAPEFMSATGVTIRLGTVDRTVLGPGAEEHVEPKGSIIIHPGLDGIMLHDIAIVKLTKPAVLSDKIKLSRLIHFDTQYEDLEVTIMGWGYTQSPSLKSKSPTVSPSTVLMKTTATLPATSRCETWLSAFFNVVWPRFCQFDNARHICYLSKIARPCHADSGSPMIVSSPGYNQKAQVGILSRGTRGCPEGEPAIYTKVLYYWDWISKTTGIPMHYDLVKNKQCPINTYYTSDPDIPNGQLSACVRIPVITGPPLLKPVNPNNLNQKYPKVILPIGPDDGL